MALEKELGCALVRPSGELGGWSPKPPCQAKPLRQQQPVRFIL